MRFMKKFVYENPSHLGDVHNSWALMASHLPCSTNPSPGASPKSMSRLKSWAQVSLQVSLIRSLLSELNTTFIFSRNQLPKNPHYAFPTPLTPLKLKLEQALKSTSQEAPTDQSPGVVVGRKWFLLSRCFIVMPGRLPNLWILPLLSLLNYLNNWSKIWLSKQFLVGIISYILVCVSPFLFHYC